jgi:hypothetical protein
MCESLVDAVAPADHSAPPVSDGVRFARGMELLVQGLGMLSEVDLAEVDPDTLGEAAVDLIGRSRQLAGVHAGVSDRFSASGAWAHAASRNARSWIGAQVNESPSRISAVLKTGLAMRAHPLMAEALLRGEVSVTHVTILATAVKDFPSLRSALGELADQIVELARLSTPARFEQDLAGVCHALDPAAVQRDERKRDSEAYLHLSPIGHGMWRLDGLLPAEVGQHLQALLDAARRRLATHGTPDPGSPDASSLGDPEPAATGELGEVIGEDVFGNPIREGETPIEAMDNRVTSRRNVDALRLLLNLAAPARNPDGGIALPSINGVRPTIHATIPVETLLEDDPRLVGWLERLGLPANVITAAKATLLACDATIEPMITRGGQLIATLPSLQTVPTHLRKAVMMRDEDCRINSCIAGIEEIHHIQYLSRGGLTVMDNLVGLCWYHHHLIHHGNWTLTGDANADLTLTNTATGQQWSNRPPRKRR